MTRARASTTPLQPPMGTPGVPSFWMFFMMVTISEAGVFAAVVDSDQPQALSASRRISGSCKAMSAPVPFFEPISFSMATGTLACAAGDSSSLKLMKDTCLLSFVIQVARGVRLDDLHLRADLSYQPGKRPCRPVGYHVERAGGKLETLVRQISKAAAVHVELLENLDVMLLRERCSGEQAAEAGADDGDLHLSPP